MLFASLLNPGQRSTSPRGAISRDLVPLDVLERLRIRTNIGRSAQPPSMLSPAGGYSRRPCYAPGERSSHYKAQGQSKGDDG